MSENNTLQPFQFPRDDWYDSEGRIYKDVIIENLNAAESKLLELADLDLSSIALPDIENVTYPDTTLSSSENKIVNLRSFLNITGSTNYPVELSFNGTKVDKLAYWGRDFVYHKISNTSTGASATQPFVIFNPVEGTVSSVAAFPTSDSEDMLIGYFENGSIINLNTTDYGDLNIMQLFSEMKVDAKAYIMWANRNAADDGTLGVGYHESRAAQIRRISFKYKKNS